MKSKTFIGMLVLFLLVLAGCGREAPEVDVVMECPYTVSDTATWNTYTTDNIFGLAAFAQDKGQDAATIILIFEYLNDSDIDSHIISEYDYLTGVCPYGYFEFDEKELSSRDGFCYVKLSYDSRIDLTVVSFDKGDERCNIGLKDGVDLTYCNFGDEEQILRTYQTYDTGNLCWNDRHSETEEVEPDDGDGYRTYTELAIDSTESEPVNEKDGVSIGIQDYHHINGSYNIYGEVEREEQTIIEFILWSEEQEVEEQDAFRLYKTIDDTDRDITPEDCFLDAAHLKDRNHLQVRMESNLLGELEEGIYRIEYGAYRVSFKLTMQTFEVW